MKWAMILSGCSILLFLGSGCSGLRSGAKVTSGEAQIYPLTTAQAEKTIYDAMTDVMVGEAFKLAPPAIGYKTRRQSMFDAHTWTAKAIPVQVGTASGFFFEVSHSGTLFNGPADAKAIYLKILELAGATAKPIPVDSVELQKALPATPKPATPKAAKTPKDSISMLAAWTSIAKLIAAAALATCSGHA